MICRDIALLAVASATISCATVVGEGTSSDPQAGDGDGDDLSGDDDGDPSGNGGSIIMVGSGGIVVGDGDVSTGGTSSGGAATGGVSGVGGVATLGGSSSGGGTGDPSGTVLFSDDFESGTSKWTFGEGWTTNSDGSQVFEQSILDSDLRVAFAGETWGDVAIEGRVKILENEDNSSSHAGFLVRTFGAIEEPNGYFVALQGNGAIKIKTLSGGSASSLNGEADIAWEVATGTWYTVRFQIIGAGMIVFVDGSPVFSNSDPTISMGMIGVATQRARAVFDDIVVTTP